MLTCHKTNQPTNENFKQNLFQKKLENACIQCSVLLKGN